MLNNKFRLGITVTVSLIVSLIAVMVNLAWPIFLWAFLVALFTFQLPKPLKSIISIRVTSVIIVILAIFQLESMSFWVLGIKTNIFLYNLVLLALILCNITLRVVNKKHILDTDNLQPKWLDCLVILPALVISGALWFRAIPSSHSTNASVVQSISLGMDDATHTMMYNDLIRSNGNLMVRPTETINMSLPQFASYTRGWHVATAVLASSFDNLKNEPVISIVESYFYMKLISLFITVLMLGAFTIKLCERLKLRLKSFVEYLTMTIIITAVAIVLLLPLYFEGFFSFLPALIYLLLFSIVGLSKTNGEEEIPSDIVLGLSTVVASMTWALLAPALIVAMIAKKRIDYGNIRKIPVITYIFLFITGFFCAIQAYMVFHGNKSSIGIIAAEGGIVAPTHLLLFVLISVFLSFYIWNKKFNSLAKDLSAILIPSSLVLIAILLYINLKSPTITYYYLKFQLILMVLLLPLSLVLLIKLVFESTTQSLSGKMTGMLLVIIVLGLSIPSILSYDYFHYILKSAGGKGTLSLEDSDMIISQSLSRSFKNDNTRLIFFYPDQPSRSIISSNIARIAYTSSDCDQDIFNAMYTMNDQSFRVSIEKCSNIIHPTVIGTDKIGYDLLYSKLPKSVLNTNNISFIVTD